jgi:signal transduction histidine kinase
MDRDAVQLLAACDARGASLRIAHHTSTMGWNQGATQAMNRNIERSPTEAGETECRRTVAARAAQRILQWFHRPQYKRLNRELNLLREERLRERARIARELHDTLFQGFLGASLQLHDAVDQVPMDSPGRPALCRTLRLIHRVIDEGRDALLGLRSAAIASMSLEEALSGVHDEFPGGAARCRIFVKGHPKPLKPEIQEQLYMIAREALVNALRHSEATSIEAEIEYLPSRLRVVVRDNGCGMDPQVVRCGRDTHWGLTGIRERADSIGAKLRIWSKPGAGTEVEISVSGQVAAADALA